MASESSKFDCKGKISLLFKDISSDADIRKCLAFLEDLNSSTITLNKDALLPNRRQFLTILQCLQVLGNKVALCSQQATAVAYGDLLSRIVAESLVEKTDKILNLFTESFRRLSAHAFATLQLPELGLRLLAKAISLCSDRAIMVGILRSDWIRMKKWLLTRVGEGRLGALDARELRMMTIPSILASDVSADLARFDLRTVAQFELWTYWKSSIFFGVDCVSLIKSMLPRSLPKWLRADLLLRLSEILMVDPTLTSDSPSDCCSEAIAVVQSATDADDEADSIELAAVLCGSLIQSYLVPLFADIAKRNNVDDNPVLYREKYQLNSDLTSTLLQMPGLCSLSEIARKEGNLKQAIAVWKERISHIVAFDALPCLCFDRVVTSSCRLAEILLWIGDLHHTILIVNFLAGLVVNQPDLDRSYQLRIFNLIYSLSIATRSSIPCDLASIKLDGLPEQKRELMEFLAGTLRCMELLENGQIVEALDARKLLVSSSLLNAQQNTVASLNAQLYYEQVNQMFAAKLSNLSVSECERDLEKEATTCNKGECKHLKNGHGSIPGEIEGLLTEVGHIRGMLRVLRCLCSSLSISETSALQQVSFHLWFSQLERMGHLFLSLGLSGTNGQLSYCATNCFMEGLAAAEVHGHAKWVLRFCQRLASIYRLSGSLENLSLIAVRMANFFGFSSTVSNTHRSTPVIDGNKKLANLENIPPNNVKAKQQSRGRKKRIVNPVDKAQSLERPRNCTKLSSDLLPNLIQTDVANRIGVDGRTDLEDDFSTPPFSIEDAKHVKMLFDRTVIFATDGKCLVDFLFLVLYLWLDPEKIKSSGVKEVEKGLHICKNALKILESTRTETVEFFGCSPESRTGWCTDLNRDFEKFMDVKFCEICGHIAEIYCEDISCNNSRCAAFVKNILTIAQTKLDNCLCSNQCFENLAEIGFWSLFLENIAQFEEDFAKLLDGKLRSVSKDAYNNTLTRDLVDQLESKLVLGPNITERKKMTSRSNKKTAGSKKTKSLKNRQPTFEIFDDIAKSGVAAGVDSSRSGKLLKRIQKLWVMSFNLRNFRLLRMFSYVSAIFHFPFDPWRCGYYFAHSDWISFNNLTQMLNDHRKSKKIPTHFSPERIESDDFKKILFSQLQGKNVLHLLMCDQLPTKCGRRCVLAISYGRCFARKENQAWEPVILPVCELNEPVDEDIFSKILKFQNYLNISTSAKVGSTGEQIGRAEYWTERLSCEEKLKNLLDQLESQLGYYRVLLSGSWLDDDVILSHWEMKTGLMVLLEERGFDGVCGDGVLEILIRWAERTSDKTFLNELVTSLCRDLPKDVRKDLSNYLFDASEKFSFMHCFAKKPERDELILCLGKDFVNIPWEGLPTMTDQPACRVPGMLYLLDRLKKSPGFGSRLDPESVSYLVDPFNDFSRSSCPKFTSWFNGIEKWIGLVGSEPSLDQFCHFLSEPDLYIYCGHGSGTRHFGDRKNLEEMPSVNVCLLMGCSSVRLETDRRSCFEPLSNALVYLATGSPAVVGNLWNVTDKDIDRYLEALVRIWLRKEPPLLDQTATVVVKRLQTPTSNSRKVCASPLTAVNCEQTDDSDGIRSKPQKKEYLRIKGTNIEYLRLVGNSDEAKSKTMVNLTRVVSEARQYCKLKCCNGAAPVVWGLGVAATAV